jgi:hypothetical protein
MNNENPTFNFSLNLEETNAILGSLQELPAKVANPITQKIREQAEAQIKKMQAEAQQAPEGAPAVLNDE